MRFLIVDDETIIREWLQMSLMSLSPNIEEVILATDGIDALEKLEGASFDAIFIDIQMPRMDGLELMKHIRLTDATTPIIILSSHTRFDYARDVMRLGALEYLLKTECTKEFLLKIYEKIEALTPALSEETRPLLSKEHFVRDLLNGCPVSADNPFSECENRVYAIIATFDIDISLKLPDNHFEKTVLNYITTHEKITYYEVLYPYSEDMSAVLHLHKTLLTHLCDQHAIMIGSSKLFRTLEDISSAILTANIAVNQLFYGDSNYCIYSIRFSSEEKHVVKNNLQAHSSNIIKHIRNYNNPAIIASINALNTFILETKPNDVTLVKETYYNTLNALYLHYFSDDTQLMQVLEDIKAQIHTFQRFDDLIGFTNLSINHDILLLSPNKEYSIHIKSALLYIAEHFDGITSVREIGDAVHLNFDYFTRLFKKEVGQNINTYLRNYRLNMAAQMLKTTLFPINDIAFRVGMANISYFSKTFKDLYNLQPLAYRNQFREE